MAKYLGFQSAVRKLIYLSKNDVNGSVVQNGLRIGSKDGKPWNPHPELGE